MRLKCLACAGYNVTAVLAENSVLISCDRCPYVEVQDMRFLPSVPTHGAIPSGEVVDGIEVSGRARCECGEFDTLYATVARDTTSPVRLLANCVRCGNHISCDVTV
jgi:hypothetical protein